MPKCVLLGKLCLCQSLSYPTRHQRHRTNSSQLKIVGVAGDGYHALELAAQVRPHVALVDTNLPVMDGIELCRRLIADDPSLAVIKLTAISEASQIETVLRQGQEDTFSKM